MDQDTFRSFLTTPRPGAPAASASSSSSSSARLAVFGGGGGAAAKPGFNPYTNKPATTEAKKDGREPKKVWKKKEGKYVDRSAARRQGLDDEFTDVLAVRDAFERRQQGDDAADIEAKRQLLGGDAEHSILVKGLDLALLARNKAALDAGQGNDDDDDELEAAFGAGPSALAPVADDDGGSRKRSRDEILAAVQRKKRLLASGSGAGALLPPPAPELNKSKFKPIGVKEDKKTTKATVGPDGQVKKLKKKKKRAVAVEDAPPAVPVAAAPAEASASPAAGPSLSPPPPPPAAAAPAPAPPAEKRFAKPLVAASLSDDDDIFGGVGDYEAGEAGSDSDADDDGDAPGPSSSTKAAGAAQVAEDPPKPVNWFRTGRTPTPPPPAALSPKGKERAASAPANDAADGADPREHASRSPSPEPVMRLVPLSGTSARDMLAAAEAAEAAAQRRSNKAKWRQSQGLAKQAGNEDEEDEDEGQGSWRAKDKEGTDDKRRLDREYVQYKNYASKADKQ